MDNQSNNTSTYRPALRRWLLLVALVAPALGIIDTGYLTAKHYDGSALTCGVFSGCDIVTTSDYSVLFGIPLALLGLSYYIALAVCIGVYAKTGARRYLAAVALISGAGLLFSLWLTYLQFFVINALCSYCLLSAVMTAIIFATSIALLAQHRIQHHEQTLRV